MESVDGSSGCPRRVLSRRPGRLSVGRVMERPETSLCKTYTTLNSNLHHFYSVKFLQGNPVW